VTVALGAREWALLVGVLLAAACGGGGEGAERVDAAEWHPPGHGRDGGAGPIDVAFAAPDRPGPYPVGVRTFVLTDPARGRTFLVDVWYPADPAAPGGVENVYRLHTASGGTLAEVPSPARRDGAPAAGEFPLVLFSHGFGGVRFQSYFLSEHLAGHGFVVVSPDHPGNTLADFDQLGDDAAAALSAVDRPLDLGFALDCALQGLAGVPLVRAEAVGATGHSFGGWTALETARRDARVMAVFPMAPGFRNGATPDFVAELARPLLLFGGSEDTTTPFGTDQQAAYALAAPPRYLVKIVGAGHLDFSNLCEVPIAAAFVDDGCDPEKIPAPEVHARVRAVAAAFARRYLLGDARYDEHLAPEWVRALGRLEYWSEP
jgi:predicted dienelactone hydrolase